MHRLPARYAIRQSSGRFGCSAFNAGCLAVWQGQSRGRASAAGADDFHYLFVYCAAQMIFCKETIKELIDCRLRKGQKPLLLKSGTLRAPHNENGVTAG
jgi:hypothetical protein